MKARFVGTIVFGIILIVLVSWDNRMWSARNATTYLFLPNLVSPAHVGGKVSVSYKAMERLSNKTKIVEVDFKKMRREALLDPKAVYLSRQATPTFDPAYKNPCWWSGKYKRRLVCLPYFYLGGFPKSGTTDLFFRLLKHPLITGGITKEPHWLTRGHFGKRAKRPILPYRNAHASNEIMTYAQKFFDHAVSKIQTIKSDNIDWTIYRGKNTSNHMVKYPTITVDASASTAWDNSNGFHIIRDIPLSETVLQSNASIIDWIVRMNPNVRFVLILREPGSRVYSDYNYFKSSISAREFDSHVNNSIDNYQKCTALGSSDLECARVLHKIGKVRIHIGLYHLHIEDLLIRIPRDRILIIRTEDYHKNMPKVLHETFHFLGLPILNKSEMDKVVNAKEKNVNHKSVTQMWSSTRKKLTEFYQPFNKRLAKLLRNDDFLWEDVYSKYQT